MVVRILGGLAGGKAGSFLTSPTTSMGVKAADDVAFQFKSPKEAAEAFKSLTGDTLQSAQSRLAGVEVRNGMRTAGNLAGEMEKIPYSPEHLRLLEVAESMGKKSPNLFHGTLPERLDSIKEKGLLPDAEKRFPGVSSETRLSLSANEALANSYAGPSGAVLRVNKKHPFADLEDDLMAGGGAYTTAKPIPPEALEIKQGKKWLPLKDILPK